MLCIRPRVDASIDPYNLTSVHHLHPKWKCWIYVRIYCVSKRVRLGHRLAKRFR